MSVSASATLILTPRHRDAYEAASETPTARLCGCVSWEEGIGCRSKAIFGGGRGGIGGGVWVIVSDACKQENANGICGFRHRGCLCLSCHLCGRRHLEMLTCHRYVCATCEAGVWVSVGWRNCGGAWEGRASGCRRANGGGVRIDRLGMGGLGRSCQLRA